MCSSSSGFPMPGKDFSFPSTSIQPDGVVPGKTGVKGSAGIRPALHEGEDIELVLAVDIEKPASVHERHELPDGRLLQKKAAQTCAGAVDIEVVGHDDAAEAVPREKEINLLEENLVNIVVPAQEGAVATARLQRSVRFQKIGVERGDALPVSLPDPAHGGITGKQRFFCLHGFPGVEPPIVRDVLPEEFGPVRENHIPGRIGDDHIKTAVCRGSGKVRTPVHGRKLSPHAPDGLRFFRESGHEAAAEGKIVFSLCAPPLRNNALDKFFAQTGYAPGGFGHERHGGKTGRRRRFPLSQFFIRPHNAAAADKIPFKERRRREGAV